jgi:hypothetical protein
LGDLGLETEDSNGSGSSSISAPQPVVEATNSEANERADEVFAKESCDVELLSSEVSYILIYQTPRLVYLFGGPLLLSILTYQNNEYP